MTSQLFSKKLTRLRKLSATQVEILDLKHLMRIATMSDQEFEDLILAARI